MPWFVISNVKQTCKNDREVFPSYLKNHKMVVKQLYLCFLKIPSRRNTVTVQENTPSLVFGTAVFVLKYLYISKMIYTGLQHHHLIYHGFQGVIHTAVALNINLHLSVAIYCPIPNTKRYFNEYQFHLFPINTFRPRQDDRHYCILFLTVKMNSLFLAVFAFNWWHHNQFLITSAIVL